MDLNDVSRKMTFAEAKRVAHELRTSGVLIGMPAKKKKALRQQLDAAGVKLTKAEMARLGKTVGEVSVVMKYFGRTTSDLDLPEWHIGATED